MMRKCSPLPFRLLTTSLRGDVAYGALYGVTYSCRVLCAKVVGATSSPHANNYNFSSKLLLEIS